MDAGAMMFFMIFMIPIVAIVVKSPIGEAAARRLGGRSAETEQRLEAEVEAMRGELDMLHEQLAEVQERLDFNERMLAAKGHTPPEGVTR
jgi:uncharacterized membrane-anchored protein YhcB (DUF1043 family)